VLEVGRGNDVRGTIRIQLTSKSPKKNDPPEFVVEVGKKAIVEAPNADRSLLHLPQPFVRTTVAMAFPAPVHRMLRRASSAAPSKRFRCHVFGNQWDGFVETWAPHIHAFVRDALGPYGTEPMPDILPLPQGMHAAQATASFDLMSGQIRLANSTEGKPGMILEKLTHEMIHGSVSQFPQGDPFTDEGFVDYSTWVLAHAPVWGPYGEAMVEAAAFNIKLRRERAFRDLTDYDRKRWAGGLFASQAYGPWIIARLRGRKLEGNFTW
jgi:hypothetical protein